MVNSKIKPAAKLDNWELYLLGFASENIRKAIILISLELIISLHSKKISKSLSFLLDIFFILSLLINL